MKTLLLVLALSAVFVLVDGERSQKDTRKEEDHSLLDGDKVGAFYQGNENAFDVAERETKRSDKKHIKEKGGHSLHHCHYRDHLGRDYNLKRLASNDVKASLDGSTYYFNPCHTVNAARCPKGSAVCEITTKGEAIAYGLTSKAYWSDGGVGSNASIKIDYYSGEPCPTGGLRKVDVELHCSSLTSPSSAHTSVKSIIKETCYLNLVLETPYACDTQTLCSSITDQETCEKNLCEWISAQEECVAPRQWLEQPITWVLMVTLALGAVGSLVILATCAGFAFRHIGHRVQRPGFSEANERASPENQELVLLETAYLETQYHPLPTQQTR